MQRGQRATVKLDGRQVSATVRRVSPQVREGTFVVDFAFDDEEPANLVAGEAAQGRLQLGSDTPALVMPTGAFLSRTGGDWLFVLDSDGKHARPRQVRLGRRNAEQVEVLAGVAAGERVVISDYTSLERADLLVLTN